MASANRRYVNYREAVNDFLAAGGVNGSSPGRERAEADPS
jgi:hypothetical protein